MSTPAGWYDDGSGRQRWWDGQQWTENFAPESPAASAVEETAAAEAAAPENATGAIDPIGTIDPIQPIAPISGIASPDAETAQLPPYAAAAYTPPTATSTPEYGAAPVYSAPVYPAGGSYPAPDEGPKKPSVLGLVGLGLAALGTILVFIPVIGFIGFILLGVGFILSIVSLFLKGKKWPGIAGLSLAIVGTILGIVMSFVYLFAFAVNTANEIDNRPSVSPSESATEPETEESTAPETGTGERPTAEQVAEGLTAIIAATGVEGYTDTQILCFGEQFVASDIDDNTLQIIASGQDTFSDADAASAFAEEFAAALPTCLTQ